MKRVSLFVGKQKTPQGSEEVYQLMIDGNSFSTVYDRSMKRGQFYDSASDAFAKVIIRKCFPWEIELFNGSRINTKTGEQEPISRLENSLAELFSDMLCRKLRVNYNARRIFQDPSMN